jgi:hypothetical protein
VKIPGIMYGASVVDASATPSTSLAATNPVHQSPVCSFHHLVQPVVLERSLLNILQSMHHRSQLAAISATFSPPTFAFFGPSGTHVCTTMVPVLTELLLKEHEPGLGPQTPQERAALAAFYLPYLVMPALMVVKCIRMPTVDAVLARPKAE